MNPVYLTGGIIFFILAAYGVIREHWSGKSAALAVSAGIVFLVAGVFNSVSTALFASVLFVVWVSVHFSERLHKRPS